MGCVSYVVIPAFFSHAVALILALISTGRVIKAKSVVMANSRMPPNMTCGNVSMVKMPMSRIHCTQLLAKLTAGTSLLRKFKGA